MKKCIKCNITKELTSFYMKKKSEEDILKLNHYTNFRPFCSKKNLEKSNKIV